MQKSFNDHPLPEVIFSSDRQLARPIRDEPSAFFICLRLTTQIILHAHDRTLADSEIILSLMESVPIRLITVGVVILERHEILEMLGSKDSSDQHDSLYELSQPHGMYYLCGGLIMECFVDAFKNPFLLLNISAQKEFMVFFVVIFSIISLLISLHYALKLIVYRRHTRHQNG
jgi:hypothetical protein